MSRWDRIKLSLAAGVFFFFIQLLLLVVNIQFVEPSTGQLRFGAQFRFKFVDETTRQFVLVSQLRRLPEEMVRVTEVSLASTCLCYVVLAWFYRASSLGDPKVDESAEADPPLLRARPSVDTRPPSADR